MTGNGFLDSRRGNPWAIGTVVALHGAVLTALILAPPETIKRIVYVPLEAINIPDTPPPEPVPPEPQPQPKVDSRIDKVPPLVPALPRPDTSLVLPDRPALPLPPPLPPLPRADPLPPQPEPVMMDAQADPRYAAAFQPDYPTAMARAEIEGRVTVRVLIGADGRVKAVERVSATDPAFFAATERQALRHWRFKPATRDGVPVESWKTLSVRFELKA